MVEMGMVRNLQMWHFLGNVTRRMFGVVKHCRLSAFAFCLPESRVKYQVSDATKPRVHGTCGCCTQYEYQVRRCEDWMINFRPLPTDHTTLSREVVL